MADGRSLIAWTRINLVFDGSGLHRNVVQFERGTSQRRSCGTGEAAEKIVPERVKDQRDALLVQLRALCQWMVAFLWSAC